VNPFGIKGYEILSLSNILLINSEIGKGLNPHWISGFSDAFYPKSRFIRKFSTKRVYNNLSLAVWGQNLPSSVGLGRFTKQESNMIQLPPFIKSVIIGLLLSDGWLTIASKTNKNARLGFAQSEAHGKYFCRGALVFFILSHYCSSYPVFRTRSRKGGDTFQKSWQLFTRSMPCFTELHSLFYVNNVKVIPSNIYDLLTPVALAHVIMGDGNALTHGLIICTNSFVVEDVVRLMNVIMIRYRLNCKIREKRQSNNKIEYMILIRQDSMALLRTIVKPYMHSSMLYKLGKSKIDC